MKTKIKLRITLLITVMFFSPLLWRGAGGEASAQNIGINATGATPNPSTILDLNTGNAFTSPNGKGLLIHNVALVYNLDEAIVSEKIAIRKTNKIKLPDAIIAATAIENKLTLITHNAKDFEKIKKL